LRDSTIGFAAAAGTGASGGSGPGSADGLLATAETKDFVEFGFEPEFIGRLPVRVVCHALNEDDLFRILKSSEGSIGAGGADLKNGIEVCSRRRVPSDRRTQPKNHEAPAA
jgi:ATP-dependent protease Clp ATPase subunit